MATTTPGTARSLRLSAEEARQRIESGQPVLILDVRSNKAWDCSDVKIAGAIRMPADDVNLDPSWPRDRFALTYCT